MFFSFLVVNKNHCIRFYLALILHHNFLGNMVVVVWMTLTSVYTVASGVGTVGGAKINLTLGHIK